MSEGLAITVETHGVHGLEGALDRPDWPALMLAEVDALLRRYPAASGARRILSFSPRPFSAASVVETIQGTVVVKRHARLIREREGLLEEHRLMGNLAGLLPGMVVSPLADERGETAVVMGAWTYEALPLARGVDVYGEALSWTPFLFAEHGRAAGRALAQLHRAAERYDAPARASGQLISSYSIFAGGDPEDSMRSYLEKRPSLCDYATRRDWHGSLHSQLMPFYSRLQPWLGWLTPLWTHNDFHASNLMWSGAGEDAEVTAIIDFGLADLTNSVYDLALAIERNCIEWLRMEDAASDIVHLDQLDALLAGYEELAPLSYTQARALAAMLPVVHCEFALSETDYFLSVLDSPEKAYLAYEGYFLGHAAWFHTAQGQALLAHLERWADAGPRKGRAAR